ncbi:MAG: hypothetical protein WC364_15370 [Eubacteriales bacterium]
MKNVAIGLALANTKGTISPEEVLTFIENQASDIETYEMSPPSPGMARAAAIDFMLLLNTAGSAASIASILWLAYDKFIAPKKDKKDNAGIVVIIRKDDHTNEQFWIGNTDKSKDVFIETFTEKIETIRHSKLSGESTERINKELSVKTIWTRRK